MDWRTKLTSRKFWAAVVNFVSQLMIAFRYTESEVAQVAAIIMATGGMIAFIIAEGMADAASAASDIYVSAEAEKMLEPPDEEDEVE